MECASYLDYGSIVLNLKGRTHEEVIGELVETFCCKNPRDKERILKSIYTVEDIKNTAVGKGVAVPHGRTDVLPNLKIAFGRSVTGVEWGSPDGRLVQMVWLIINPRHQAGRSRGRTHRGIGKNRANRGAATENAGQNRRQTIALQDVGIGGGVTTSGEMTKVQ